MRLPGYRLEPLVLVLVAMAALAFVNRPESQDFTRFEATRHVVLYHTLTIEPNLFDHAEFNGRTYSDKAPGMSFLAVPVFQAERVLGVARAPRSWNPEGDASLWGVRVFTSGLPFLGCVFLLGRYAELLVPRTGAATAAIFGVGTLATPLAPTLFEHDAAAALTFAAFVLVALTSRALLLALAGLLAGTAVLFEYSAAIAAAVIAGFCVYRHGRGLIWLAAGAGPAAVALGAYDRAAFGSPFHLSYRYVANKFATEQHRGFFGISIPSAHGLYLALVGNRGLLVYSPVLVAAAVGLGLLWRRGFRAETLVAAVIVVVFVVVDAGYFLPYGGVSPGPRFFALAVPFLALGLAGALGRYPRTTLALGAVSALLTLADAATWSKRPQEDTSWLVRRHYFGNTVWMWLGSSRPVGVGLALVCGLAAVAVGSLPLLRSDRTRSEALGSPS
ncbi:MAG TPA: hypothetical protein VH541_08140 [Gaiellaceae bacterium]|jgi:hypothetical protein